MRAKLLSYATQTRFRNHPEKVRLSLIFFHVARRSEFHQRSGLDNRCMHDVVQILQTEVLVS